MIKTSNDIAKKARILRFGKAYQKEYEKTQRKKSGFKRPVRFFRDFDYHSFTIFSNKKLEAEKKNH